MPNLSASFQYKLSAWTWLTWTWLAVVVSWLVAWLAWCASGLAVVAMRLCRSTLVVEVWCWAMWLAGAVVTTSWRARPTLYPVAMHRSCVVVVMVAWRHIDSYIHLAWTTRLCAIKIACHCTADCHC